MESELQLPAHATDTAMPDPSWVWDLHHSSWQLRILNPLSKVRDRTCNLRVPIQIRWPLCHNGNSSSVIFLMVQLPMPFSSRGKLLPPIYKPWWTSAPYSTGEAEGNKYLSLPLAIGCSHGLVSAGQTLLCRSLHLKEARMIKIPQAAMAGCLVSVSVVMATAVSWQIFMTSQLWRSLSYCTFSKVLWVSPPKSI